MPEGKGNHLSHTGGKEEVSQVCTSSTGKMGVTEAQNGAVGIMITGAAVPSVRAGIRAQLHQAMGRGGTGIGMAVETGSVKYIHCLQGRFGTAGTAHYGSKYER